MTEAREMLAAEYDADPRLGHIHAACVREGKLMGIEKAAIRAIEKALTRTPTPNTTVIEALEPFAKVGDLCILEYRRDAEGMHWIGTRSFELRTEHFRRAYDVHKALASRNAPEQAEGGE